jgi:peptidoglycan/LPS O-acetylase OafA/YrhL
MAVFYQGESNRAVASRVREGSAGDRPFFGRVESLRALGAMAVAAYHAFGWTLHGVVLFPETPWKDTGPLQNAIGQAVFSIVPAHAALMVFFVISGFVLRLSLEHGPARFAPAAARFLLGRVFRIYPVVMFSVLLTAVLLAMGSAKHGQGLEFPSAERSISNLLLFDVSMNGPLWALQVELLMMPAILCLYFLERRTGPTLILGVAVISTALAYSNRWALWPPLSTNVFPFILGMVVPTLGRRLVSNVAKWVAFGCSAGAVIVLLLTHPCFGLYSRISAVLEAYAAAVLVSLVAYRCDLGLFGCLDAKWLRLVGRSSGSYYVLHMATLPPALAIASAFIPQLWTVVAPGFVGCLFLASWLLALAPVAICSFHLIEAPGVALGRRLIQACRLDMPPFPRADTKRAMQRAAELVYVVPQ